MKLKSDFLPVLLLFLIFALASLGIVLTGAGVYKRIVTNMDQSYEERTALAYVTEKVRQNDAGGCITVKDDILSMQQNTEDGSYTLYLYEHNGYLMELLTESSASFQPEAGQKILENDFFSASFSGPSLLTLTTGSGEHAHSVSLYLYATPEADAPV